MKKKALGLSTALTLALLLIAVSPVQAMMDGDMNMGGGGMNTSGGSSNMGNSGMGMDMDMGMDDMDMDDMNMMMHSNNMPLMGSTSSMNQMMMDMMMKNMPSSTTDTIAPEITSFSINPTSINVNNNEKATIGFHLSEPAMVLAKVYDSNNIVITTLINNFMLSQGDNTVTWNGTNSMWQKVAAGTYTIKIDAQDMANNKSGVSSGTVNVANGTVTNPSDTSAPTFNNIMIAPTSITSGGTANINFNLSKDAYITVKIYNSSNTLIATLANQELKTSGTVSLTWDGKDNSMSGMVMNAPVGTYTVKIDGMDSSHNHAVQSTATIIVN